MSHLLRCYERLNMMKKWIASGLILLLIPLSISSLKQIERIYSSSPDPSLSYSLKFKVYFNGSILAESIGESVSPDPNRTEITSSADFTKNEDVVILSMDNTILLPTEYPFFSLSGNGSYADGFASGEGTIHPITGLPLEDAVAEFNLTETRICANASGTILYETYLGYEINNETVRELIDLAQLHGANQSYANSTIYGYTGGKVECTELLIDAVNGTSSALITFSMKIEGDIFLGLVYMLADLTGQPPPSEEQEETISSLIDDALDLVINSSFTMSYSVEGELNLESTTYLVGTFDDDVTDLKDTVLVNFFSGIEGFDFLHHTDFRVSNLSVTYSSDADEWSWSLKWLFLNPPLEHINATDFDIRYESIDLFDALGGLDLPSENLTFTIEGESNATHEVIVIVPPNVTQPDESNASNSSVTWQDVSLGDLEDIWFRVSSVTPPVPPLILTLQDLFKFTVIAGIIMATVIMVQQSRKGTGPAGDLSLKQEEETSSSADQ